jgi:type I restriction enzyme R subunit
MNPHREIHLETEICEHLDANGWLNEEADAAKYDRARALIPEDMLAATQPKAWVFSRENPGTWSDPIGPRT